MKSITILFLSPFWNIETMFRVHDEARIKTKSKVPIVRLFYFLISLVLIFIWSMFEKNKVTFKLFIIELFDGSAITAPSERS